MSSRNIQEFCRVLKQLPSLEGERNRQQQGSGGSGSSSGGGNGDLRRETRLNPATADGAIVTEELRKVLLALSPQDELVVEKNNKRKKSVDSAGSKKPAPTVVRRSISPEALFHVIWKVVPRFR